MLLAVMIQLAETRIYKTINMLLKREFGTLNSIIQGHYTRNINKKRVCWHENIFTMTENKDQ